MPPRIGPDYSIRVAVSGTHNAIPWANVFWCQATASSPTQADLDAWLHSFLEAYKTAFMGQVQNTVYVTLGKATMFLPGGTVLQSSESRTDQGSRSDGEVKDNSVSKIVSWATNVYWRGGKPRTYIPGVGSADVDGAHALNSGTVTALAAEGASFLAAINGLTHGSITATVLGFVSFTTGNTPRTPPIFFPFTGARVHPRLGTQRRRLGAWLP